MTTCTLVRFITRESRVGANATNSSGRPCCIREIRFRECNDMEIADFQSAIQSLRDADAWTTMERVVPTVVVENCRCLDWLFYTN